MENGRIEMNGTSYYARAYYRCNSGYSNYPPGAFYQACGGSGWIGVTPKCGKFNLIDLES